MPKAPHDKNSTEGERTPAETERIREATLKKLLSTPPKPFTKSTKGKSTGKKAADES